VVAVEHHGIEPQTSRQSRQALGITRSLNVVESALADLFLDPCHTADVTDESDRGASREKLVGEGQAADHVTHTELGPAVAAEADMKTHAHSVP